VTTDEVTTYYLEMSSPFQLQADDNPRGLVVTECKLKQFEYNRFLYALVGSQWAWTDKLSWTDLQWKAYAESDSLRTWVAYFEGTPAGYFELQMQDAEAVEICYFGLSVRFIGKGFGGYLLSEAIRHGWEWGASRVWVHTCTLDHPSALRNYKARGMRLYRTDGA